jgi:hypothetical protein
VGRMALFEPVLALFEPPRSRLIVSFDTPNAFAACRLLMPPSTVLLPTPISAVIARSDLPGLAAAVAARPTGVSTYPTPQVQDASLVTPHCVHRY